MHYLATIKFGSDSHTQLFGTEKDATQWLDSKNNNLEYTTIITILDDKWCEVDSYYYTEGTKE